MENEKKKDGSGVLNTQPPCITDGRPKSWSAFKLGDGRGDEVPVHFEELINNTIKERWKLLESKTIIDITDYPLACDLLCCVALVIALEEGFRLDECHLTQGFDVRVLRALKHMPPFRIANKSYRMNLMLPDLLNLQFTLLVVPAIEDCSIINFMAVGKTVVRQKAEIISLSTSAIRIPTYINVISQACAKLTNVKSLSLIIRPIFYNVKKRALLDYDIVVPASFMGLPEEVKKYVLKYLGTKDFLALTSTNLSLHTQFAFDTEIWRYYLERDMKIKKMSDIDGVNHPLNAYKAWFRRSHQDGRRSNLTTPPNQSSSSRPVRSISELSSTSTPTTASQRSQARSAGSEWEF